MATDFFQFPFSEFPPIGHSFQEKENRCRVVFDRALQHFGPFYHLHTPEEHPVIFRKPADYEAAMTLVALCAHDCPKVRIITFELMSNHVHFVICGSLDDVLAFFALFKKRLKRYFDSQRIAANLSGFVCHTVEIHTLESLRNQIGYTNRNNFVVNPAFTPFSYPYGAGNCYYLPVNQQRADRHLEDLTAREKRKMLHTHQIEYPKEFAIVDQHISPANYCAIAFGEAIFRDARHYFFKIAREIEGYKEIAEALSERVFYTDDELSAVIYRICKRDYAEQHATLLPQSAKIDIAKRMHFDYDASNEQIARMLKLSVSYVNGLFPMRKRS